MMTVEETIIWLNKLYARADITDEYGDMEDMQPYEEAVDMASKALDQTRWIPVNERLPEKPGRYLAYIVNEYDDKLQYIMTCEYYRNWYPDDECASRNVIAWMSLPEPYKVESEDNR